jgi:hypothetical protein
MGLKELPAPFDAEERFSGRYRPPGTLSIYLPGLAVLALGVALHYLGLLAFGKTIDSVVVHVGHLDGRLGVLYGQLGRSQPDRRRPTARRASATGNQVRRLS